MSWLSLALAAPFPNLLETPAGEAVASPDAAVVVGLEDYGFLPDVPFARRDAMAVRTLLVHSLGLPAERVRTLESANREQLLEAIDAAVTQVGPGGKLIVWFSGHGATSPVDGSMLLVGDDAKPQPDAFASRSVSVAELSARVPGDALLVLDACAAGQARDGKALLPGVRFAVPSWATAEPGLRVWTAASPTELAEPYPAAEHGLFTALAIGALRGWGDVDADGEVTLDEAQDYVQRAMLSVGGRQRPTLSGPDLVVGAAREGGPPLADLPRLTRLSAPMPSPEPTDAGPAFVGPYVLEGGRVRTGDGQLLSLPLVAAEVDDDEVKRLRKQQRTASAASAAGVGLAGAAAVVGGYLSLYHAISATAFEPAVPLGTKLAVPGALVGVGIGTGVTGLVVARKKRSAVVERMNAVDQ